MILGLRQSSLQYSFQEKVIREEAEGDNKFQCTEGKKDKANHNPKS